MHQDRFKNAKPVHTEKELEQKTHNDNYAFWKRLKEWALLPVGIALVWILGIIFAFILVGFLMDLLGCPLIKPGVSSRLQEVVRAVLAWGIGVVSHYSFGKWKETVK